MQITTLIYDNTFQGFLSAVFEVYEYRLDHVSIVPRSRPQNNLFGSHKITETNDDNAARVWKGLLRHISADVRHNLYQCFLSELPDMEDMLLLYFRHTFANGDRSKDFGHPAVLYVTDIARKVHREKHRMEAFVRFRQTADNLYYATVEPDFNVLPLIAVHFERRYADQQWLIYDMRRNYGICYDLHTVSTVEIDFRQMLSGRNNADHLLDEREKEYELLWCNYFKSVNIASRKNLKLHRQHMPLRYWKYLTEKQ